MSTTNSKAQPRSRWPWQRSFQLRITAAFGSVFLLVLALLTLWIGRTVFQTYLDAAEHELEVEAFLAANALEDPLSGYAAEFEQFRRWEEDRQHETSDDNEDGDDESKNRSDDSVPAPALPAGAFLLPRLQNVAEVYARDSGANVTILDLAGVAVASSQRPPQEIPNQLARPEVQSALAGQEREDVRGDDATGALMLFAAAPIQQGSQVLGVVQMSQPLDEALAGARDLLLSVVLAALAALALFVALAAWLARQLVRPVRDMEEAALAAAAGDLTQRVPVQTADELGALAAAFNHMIDEVRATLERQRAFVANASHELRTPLTNIKLRAEAVRTLGADEPALTARYVAELEGETDRMTRIANDLLELSQIENGVRPAAAPQAVDLAQPLREAAAIMRLRAEQAKLTLQVAVPAALPLVTAHAEEIAEAVINLLDNAIKYTPAGGEVTLAAAATDSQIEIRVADSGPGIPAEDLPYIFDRFYRVDKVRSRQRGQLPGVGSGAGLGLSITKALVEQNGGAIAAAAAGDAGGMVFTIKFPMTAEAENLQSPISQSLNLVHSDGQTR
jgi:signal transduction histidine kinase